MSSEITVATSGAICRVELNRPECGNLATMGMVETLTETVAGQPLDAVKAVKEFLKQAPSMPDAGRGALASALFATVLSSR